jgi:GDP-4-dehydro-6-deoxy-D-mannose reductase
LVRSIRPRVIYHLAASLTGTYDVDYTVNALSARYLMEACETHCPAARIILMGSAAEYGVVDPPDNPISETRALHPVSVYGLTKAFQTHLAGYFAHARGVDVVVARMFNLLAEGLSEKLFVGRVQRLIERYKRGEAGNIEVGNLDNRRDYVDSVEAVSQIRAIAARGVAGGVYHVASGKAVSMRDLLYRMLDAANIPREAVREATPGAGGRSGYDVPVIFADMRRTRALMEMAQ